MKSAGPEYLTDVPYLRQFCGDLSPALLRLVAGLNGFEAPPADDFDFCELGAGSGDTTATLAAAYPRARFVGVDINPEHVASGNELASRGGLGNVRFLERDLEDLKREDLPAFDYICAYGLLSWIAPPKRRALIELAQASLKPGGLLFVSYNALPGWAAVEPLRRLMRDASPDTTESLERARRGLGLAKALAEGGARYFGANPAAASMLGAMTQAGLPYVVHEYLHPHWHPMYFVDVAREMAACDIHFIGQLPLHGNCRDLTIPPALMNALAPVVDRIAFEGLKDFVVNEFFRRDVFVKGAARRSDATTRAALDATPFGTLAAVEQVKREVALPHCTLRFGGALFDALIPVLAERAATVPELASKPALAAFGADKLRESLLLLALGEQAVPMRALPRAPEALPGAGYRVPLAYNRKILEQPLSSARPIVLASPVAGTGVTIAMLHAVSIRLLAEVLPADRPGWIRAFAARQPLRLRVGERAVDDVEEQAALIAAELEAFTRTRAPKLVELGILERTG
jgi:SAM-dependent methyltransferase